MEDDLHNSTSPEASSPHTDGNQDMVHESEPTPPPSDKTDESPSPATFYRPPRLGIIHLICWTALTAVLLSIYQSVTLLTDQKSLADSAVTLPQQLSLATGVIQIIFVAACLVGVFIIVRDKWHGVPGRLQPGHWIVFANCCHAITAILVFALIHAVLSIDIASDSNKLSTTILLYAVPQALVYLLLAGLYIAGSVRCPAGFLWRSLLGLRGLEALFAVAFTLAFLVFYLNKSPTLQSGMTALFSYAGIISTILSTVLPIVILLIVIVRDLYLKNRRDWLHWLGAVILLATILKPLSYLI